VFEASGFGPDIVVAMSGFDVLVVGPAIENHVAIRGYTAGVGVVVDRVGIEDVGAVVNLCPATQFEYGPIFFLLQSADGDLLRIDGGRRGGRR